MDETNITSQANSDSYKTNPNAEKGACNEARRSEEEHVEISEEEYIGRRECRTKGTIDKYN